MELKEFRRNKYLRAPTTAPYHVLSTRSLGAKYLVSAAAWVQELKTGPGWSRLLEQRGAQLLVVALLIALAIDCAVILTRSLSQFFPPASSAAVVKPLPRPAANPTVELATIVNAHLFGVSGASSAGGQAPQTTMPLVLAGVIAEKDPAKGQAIIGDSAAVGKLYAVGAMISGGVRLNAVYGDRVLLERNGALETLMLPRTAPKGGSAPAPAANARTSSLQDNATVLAGLVRVQPVFNQGKLTGYRIFPGGTHGSATFNQLGLRAGDLILAVNGTPLDDASKAMEVLQTLSSSASATVTVSRNGQPQEVNLNLATLSTDVENASTDNAAGTGTEPPNAAPGVPPTGMRGRLSNMATQPAPGAAPVSPAAGTGNSSGGDAPATGSEK
jgi:general secretion pathway protein C